MATLNTKWVLTQDDVNTIVKDNAKISFSLLVKGSTDSKPVTWLQLSPWQETDIALTATYGVFLSSKTPMADTVISTMSRFNVQLGTCYTWTGSDLKVDRLSTCGAGTVKMTNGDDKTWTFGLTKLDPKNKDLLAKPINAQSVLAGVAAGFTPVPTVLVKVGADAAGTVIGEKDVELWQQFKVLDLNTTFNFDSTTKQWRRGTPDGKPISQTEPAKPIAPEKVQPSMGPAEPKINPTECEQLDEDIEVIGSPAPKPDDNSEDKATDESVDGSIDSTTDESSAEPAKKPNTPAGLLAPLVLVCIIPLLVLAFRVAVRKG